MIARVRAAARWVAYQARDVRGKREREAREWLQAHVRREVTLERARRARAERLELLREIARGR